MIAIRTPASSAAAAAAIVFLIAVFISTKAAAAAWLFLFVMALGISVGALSLLLTGRLTRGVWFETLEPALLPMARAIPFVGLGFIPLMLLAPFLYPWASQGAHDHLLGLFYLNWPLVIMRAILAVGGWTALAWFVTGAPRYTMRVAAGLGLVFHVIITTFLAYDWIISLQTGFTSSAFGAHVAILFLLSAMCLGTVIAPPLAGRPAADIAGLIMAGVLGCVYIGFMQFLIIWYGDLAETAQFYLDRAGIFGVGTIILLLVVGGLVPLTMLLPAAGRCNPVRLRAAAGLVLAGITLHWGWILLGLFRAPAIVILVIMTLVAAIAFALTSWRGGEPVRGAAK